MKRCSFLAAVAIALAGVAYAASEGDLDPRRVLMWLAADGYRPISSSYPLPTGQVCGSVARSSSSGSTSSFELTAATTDRIAFTIENDSTTDCYCIQSTSDAVAATADGWDFRVFRGTQYESPYGWSYQGEINCECDATDGYLEYFECIR